jgi:Na+-transporting methylmalonyl-CoA/oxaloacetate decarboxylase gamma subunit
MDIGICGTTDSNSLSLANGCRCRTFEIKPLDSTLELPNFYTGIFLYEKIKGFVLDANTGEIYLQDSCQQFPADVQTDARWRSARGLQYAGWATGMALTLTLFVSACSGCSQKVYRAIGCLYLLICCLFTGLIFLALDSDLCKDNYVLNDYLPSRYPMTWDKLGNPYTLYRSDCEIGNGAIMIILACIGYFMTGISTCWLRRKEPRTPKVSSSDEDEEEQVHVVAAAAVATSTERAKHNEAAPGEQEPPGADEDVAEKEGESTVEVLVQGDAPEEDATR